MEAVLAQRLVRKLCPACQRTEDAEPHLAVAFGLPPDALSTVQRGSGCAECRGTGYRGRVGIYELLTISDAIRAALPERRGAVELHALAIQNGMHTLRDDGLRLVFEGVTTPEEVLRVTAG